MRSKWGILLSIFVIILLAVAVGFYFIFPQKEADKKPEIISALPIEEKVPQKEEAIKHEQEEKREIPVLPPLSEDRKLLQ